MIAKLIRGADFGGLYRYLTGVDKQLGKEDVRLFNVISLASSALEMRLAASRSQALRPVYHIILTWREDEDVDLHRQMNSAESLLHDIGLEDHQAIVVRHHEPKVGGLTPGPGGRHYEVHVMANRVGPDGRAKRMSFDKAVVEKAVAKIAEEHKFLVVPGKFNKAPVGEFARSSYSSEAARSYMAASGRLTVCAEIRGNTALLTALTSARASGWDELIATFDAAGFRLEESAKRGRVVFKSEAGLAAAAPGLVVVDKTDVRRREKISALDTGDMKWGRGALEKLLGPLDAEGLLRGHGASGISASRETSKPVKTTALREEFERQRAAVREARTILLASHAAERDTAWSVHRRERDTLLSRAKLRRLLVRALFERRTAFKLNRFVDGLLSRSLSRHRATFLQDIAGVRLRQKTELVGVEIPAWAAWQRAESRRRPVGEQAPEPGHAPIYLQMSESQLAKVESGVAARMAVQTAALIQVLRRRRVASGVNIHAPAEGLPHHPEPISPSSLSGSNDVEGATATSRSDISAGVLRELQLVAEGKGALERLSAAKAKMTLEAARSNDQSSFVESVAPSEPITLPMQPQGLDEGSTIHASTKTPASSHVPFREQAVHDVRPSPFPFSEWKDFPRRLARLLLLLNDGGSPANLKQGLALLAFELAVDDVRPHMQSLIAWSKTSPSALESFKRETRLIGMTIVERRLAEHENRLADAARAAADAVAKTVQVNVTTARPQTFSGPGPSQFSDQPSKNGDERKLGRVPPTQEERALVQPSPPSSFEELSLEQMNAFLLFARSSFKADVSKGEVGRRRFRSTPTITPELADVCESWNRSDRDVVCRWFAYFERERRFDTKSDVEEGRTRASPSFAGPSEEATSEAKVLDWATCRNSTSWLSVIDLLYRSITTDEFDECEIEVKEALRRTGFDVERSIHRIYEDLPDLKREIDRYFPTVRKITLADLQGGGGKPGQGSPGVRPKGGTER